uniref:Putative neurotoxin LTDF 11-05 n=1 Tax=Dolomedes fimbriatus TaxID=1432569 RepID=A0A0K1D8W6_9ARAC|nr:putative neurotoxin LTDF 11-05 [Dolomedes fimbriatus]
MNSRFFRLFLLFAVATCVLSEIYCPKSRNPTCNLSYKINHCCSQAECRMGDVCCVEACGNVCRRGSDTTQGKKFVDGSECTLGREWKSGWFG